MGDPSASITYFDLTVRGDHVGEDLAPVVTSLRPDWPLEKLMMEELSGGLVNTMICVWEADDAHMTDAFIVRMHGLDIQVIQSRDHEFQAMQIAHATGCFPQIYATFNNGVIYKYSRGRFPTFDDLKDPEILNDLMSKIYRFQHADPETITLVNQKGEPIPYQKYERRIEDTIHKLIERIPEKAEDEVKDIRFQKYKQILSPELIEQEVTFMRQYFSELEFGLVLTHDDIHLKNLILNEETKQCVILDYEMSAMSYEGLDLARFITTKRPAEMIGLYETQDGPLSEKKRRSLIECYVRTRRRERGEKTDELPEEELQLWDVQHRILEICIKFEAAVTILTVVNIMTEGVDFMDVIDWALDHYFSEKSQLDGLKEKYLALKKILDL